MAKQNLTIRFTPEEREWLEKEAQAQYRTTANFVRYVLSLYRESGFNGIVRNKV